MQKKKIQEAEGFVAQHRRRRIWQRIAGGLACVVVFCTTYALILPAITMENAGCGLTEHTHTEACYTKVTAETSQEPVCTLEGLNLHRHDTDCYDENGNLVCGYADFVVHEHDKSCYDGDGNLWCPLPEIEAHTHDDSCYAQRSDVHTHDDDCYTVERGELVCTKSEGDAHQHTDECYEQNKVLTCDLSTEPGEDGDAEPELICGEKEIILHKHNADCFDEDNNLICGKIQVLEHVHSADCFRTTETTSASDADELTCTIPEGDGAHTHSEDCYDDAGELICGQKESEGHQHTKLCYGTWELTCGLEEHTHTEACTAAELTEEEQAQVDEVIALIDALPTLEQLEEQSAFEDAGDEDSYDAYLAEVIAQATQAHDAYESLTEAQKLKVTNAARLMALESLWSAQPLAILEKLTGDTAYVSEITVTGIKDGTAPFDADDQAGNDSDDGNGKVRTFDTVTYQFEVQMDGYGNDTYSEARVKLEFVLPLTQDQAVFDQTAMAWMDRTSGYEPKLTTETRVIDGVETECQVLTCYMHLLPSAGHQSTVPGTFGENVTVNVKSMKNGVQFAPQLSAAMEYGTWEGDCPTHHRPEKATVTAGKITVSAAPKYNISIDGYGWEKDTFDFSTGTDAAKGYGDGYFTENSQVVGRATKIGIVLELYNDNASKGYRGIELPEGDITFDLTLKSNYQINAPASGTDYAQGQTVDVTQEYCPLLWSCDISQPTSFGRTNRDGRKLGAAETIIAPCGWNWTEDSTDRCYDSGTWTATQKGDTIHVTVSDYTVDVDKMPITKLQGSGTCYGEDLGIGVFSAGELWIVQPFNKMGETSSNDGPVYDVVGQYGSGVFQTSMFANTMKATTVSGQIFADGTGKNDAQTVTNDDRLTLGLELTLPGSLQNRVNYALDKNNQHGVGVKSNRDGADFAAIGTEFSIRGGFSYIANGEAGNAIYYATTLVKFYGSAIEVLKPEGNTFSGNNTISIWKNREYFKTYYAVKPDGTDWANDFELQHTYEDGLIFYENLTDIPEGYLCVGVLYCFSDPDNIQTVVSYYSGFVRAKVRENMDLADKTYMLASTTRGWTRKMFISSVGSDTMPTLTGTRETDNANLAAWVATNTPDWTQSAASRKALPAGNYNSANVEGSTWYTKAVYAEDGSGIETPHNSDWSHWGDTLLVIGYKTGITKNLAQKSDEDTDKTTYNLDADQRVVDFRLQPRTYFDQGQNDHSVSTTVTITDTLPKYLAYRAGSAYFGGSYTQTSKDGGTQGTVTGGTLTEPTVTANADGTQTLVWTIEDVTVGEAMPVIHYSVNIGDRDNPDEDVPLNTTNLVNQVRIAATHDLRQPSLENGNYAEVGMAVTRGTASSFGKYSKQKLVEPDGVIDYVAYFDNNSASATEVVLLDTMPYDSISGSHFNGTYTVNSWKLNVETCDATKVSLYYTMDEQYKEMTTASLGGNEFAKKTIKSWTKAEIAADGTAADLNGKRPVAWAIVGTLENNQRIQVDMQVQLQPDQSTTGNEIQNNYYVNTISSGDTAIHTETPTVNRTLEGLTWLDDSADGIQNEDASRRISGVKVELLKLKDGGNPSNESDYEPFCYIGTDTPVAIETGKRVSVRAQDSTADYEPGRYKFIDLPAGTFAVRFTDGSQKISPLIASPDNRGTDDALDSDGKATYANDRSALEKTVILGVELPTAEEMNVTLFESKHHDSGFYEKGHELPETGGSGTIPYIAGGLVLAIGAGLSLLYQEKQRRKEESASS